MGGASFPLTVVNQIEPAIGALIAQMDSRIRVVNQARNVSEPWKTEGADILLTGPSTAWKNAPATPPATWHPARWVQIASAGTDGFPQWFLEAQPVSTGRGNAAVPIAEYVLLAMLAHVRRFETFRVSSPQEWSQQGGTVNYDAPLRTLSGQTLGLAGYGAIGREVARLARSFGMEVRVWRRSPWLDGEEAREGVQAVRDLGTLFGEADHLVLALPLTDETHRIVDRDVLSRSRPGLHLVNVARGALIDEDALLESLDRGLLAAATLDVTSPEPPPAGHRFYTHPGIRLTPHVSWSGPGVAAHLRERITRNIENFLHGRPLESLLDPRRGY